MRRSSKSGLNVLAAILIPTLTLLSNCATLPKEAAIPLPAYSETIPSKTYYENWISCEEELKTAVDSCDAD